MEWLTPATHPDHPIVVAWQARLDAARPAPPPRTRGLRFTLVDGRLVRLAADGERPA